MILFDYVKVIPNSIPQEGLEFFKNLRTSNTSQALVGDGSLDNQKENDYRKTKWIALENDVRFQLNNTFSNLYNNSLIQTFRERIKNIEPPQYLYYTEGDKYDVHNDSEDVKNGVITRVCDRDVTILCYLNDEFEGGELEFPDFSVKIKPKAGMIIAFPSYIEFSHRVHPVKSGERYTLVTWIETEDRIYNQWR